MGGLDTGTLHGVRRILPHRQYYAHRTDVLAARAARAIWYGQSHNQTSPTYRTSWYESVDMDGTRYRLGPASTIGPRSCSIFMPPSSRTLGVALRLLRLFSFPVLVTM